MNILVKKVEKIKINKNLCAYFCFWVMNILTDSKVIFLIFHHMTTTLISFNFNVYICMNYFKSVF